MDKQSNHSTNEIQLLVLQLAQQFNKKFDEQARVIVDQRDQLESQQEQIHNQRAIIDELAWQIRDLRDSVRKCSEGISNVHSKYYNADYDDNNNTYDDITYRICNGPAENRLKLIIPEANATRQSNHRAGRKIVLFVCLDVRWHLLLSSSPSLKSLHTDCLSARLMAFVPCSLCVCVSILPARGVCWAISCYFQLSFSIGTMDSKCNQERNTIVCVCVCRHFIYIN